MINHELLPMVLDYINDRTYTLQWRALTELTSQFIDTETMDWSLPMVVCRAEQVPTELAIPASAALLCAQASIILIDDILDNDPKGYYRTVGAGKAANLAAALEALAIDCLVSSSTPLEARDLSIRALVSMLATTARGQDLDTQDIGNEDQYWAAVKMKSTPFYGLAMRLGAYMARCGDETAANLHDLGVIVGEIVQLHDDLFDALDAPAKPDWSRRGNNLLILYALRVDHEEREEFSSRLENIDESENLARLQEILASSGAISYCVYQIVMRHELIVDLVTQMDLRTATPVMNLVRDQLLPVRAILERTGVRIPDLFESIP